MKHESFIAFGSNLGDKEMAISSALEYINRSPYMEILATSSIYSSEPWGFTSENDFYNGVCLIQTMLSPDGLLEALQRTEKQVGRASKTFEEYTDRLIDLDILSYDRLVINTSKLTIPHPQMHVRNFVLQPLAEIAPNWVHPLYLVSSESLRDRSTDTGSVHKKNAL